MAEEQQGANIDNNSDESTRQGPIAVSFPRTHPQLPPLKLEVEDGREGMEPRNMWQVYAFGGFLIVRWLWARWQERKARRKGEGEDSDGHPR